MWIFRLQRSGAVLGGQVAHDGVRFPQNESVVFLQGRHQAIGVHRQIVRLLVAAERAADVEPLMRYAKLADRPHYFLHIDGIVAAQDFQHDDSPVSVMPGLGSGIHAFAMFKTWMAGTSPAMTRKDKTQSSLRASSGNMIGMPSRIG